MLIKFVFINTLVACHPSCINFNHETYNLQLLIFDLESSQISFTPASPEFGTAQPQLVSNILFIAFYAQKYMDSFLWIVFYANNLICSILCLLSDRNIGLGHFDSNSGRDYWDRRCMCTVDLVDPRQNIGFEGKKGNELGLSCAKLRSSCATQLSFYGKQFH